MYYSYKYEGCEIRSDLVKNIVYSFSFTLFLNKGNYRSQAMLLAFDAILGHKSAHSFATGPVIAEPFISPLLLTMTPALSSK
jgi:hypothetical protein